MENKEIEKDIVEKKDVTPKEKINKNDIETFEVVKILNKKDVMCRSTKTGLLYSKPNKNYNLKQIIK